jgi:hypothetical protein
MCSSAAAAAHFARIGRKTRAHEQPFDSLDVMRRHQTGLN